MNPILLKSALAAAVSWGLFPVVMGAAIVTIYLAPSSGMPAQQAQMIVFFTTLALIFAFERWLPANRDWTRPIGMDRRVDATSFIVLMGVADPLTRMLAAMVLTVIVAQLGYTESLGLFPNDLPFLAQLGIAMLVAEFGQYWMHRLAHEWKALWRFHAVHHSSERIYWLNGFRVHPLNMLWHFFSGTFVLMLLGASEHIVVVYLTVAAVASAFQHANIGLKFGWLNYIFSTNELHRWHHSTGPGEGNSNYGSVLIFWDILFGTRFMIANAQPARLGLYDNSGYPQASYLKQFFRPFMAWAQGRSR